MLAGGDVAEMKALSRVVQKAWGSLAQNGTPNGIQNRLKI